MNRADQRNAQRDALAIQMIQRCNAEGEGFSPTRAGLKFDGRSHLWNTLNRLEWAGQIYYADAGKGTQNGFWIGNTGPGKVNGLSRHDPRALRPR